MDELLRVVGIDPGPVPGIVVLDAQAGVLLGAEVLQCTAGLAPLLLEKLILDVPSLVATERFVVGRRAGRSAAAAAGARTRDLVGELRHVVDTEQRHHGRSRWIDRSAGEVKPWATDARLDAAGLAALTKGMRHARDGARHALFAAVRDGALPDPLSRRSAS